MSEKLAVLRERLAPLLAEVIERHGVADQLSVDAVFEAVVRGIVSPQKRVCLSARERILKESAGRPVCWICNFEIPMDAPEDSYACFSIDHVKERRCGGQWLGAENLRPAHRICNVVRSNPPRSKTQRRYLAFFARTHSRRTEGPYVIIMFCIMPVSSCGRTWQWNTVLPYH